MEPRQPGTRAVIAVKESGVTRIFFYNWPIYVGTWLGALFVLVLPWQGEVSWVVAGGALFAVLWSLVSLGVSHFIYDRSELVEGRWVAQLLNVPAIARWASIDAGLDAEVDLSRVLGGEKVATLDIFSPEFMKANSIRRARGRTARVHAARAASPMALPLENDSLDAVTIVFSAHELRVTSARERFFDELIRIVKPGGRVLLVEHLRDTANFIAFGPGFLHFLPRSEWLRLATRSGLRVAHEIRVTPWVMALALEKPR